MDKIAIYCATESLQIFKLCVSSMKEKFGKAAVGKSTIALSWDLDQVSDVMLEKFNRKNKKIILMRNEGFNDENVENLKTFLKLMIDKGCNAALVIDTRNEERLYTGTDLKDKVLSKLTSMEDAIDVFLNY